jgi:hypothetical protein
MSHRGAQVHSWEPTAASGETANSKSRFLEPSQDRLFTYLAEIEPMNMLLAFVPFIAFAVLDRTVGATEWSSPRKVDSV